MLTRTTLKCTEQKNAIWDAARIRAVIICRIGTFEAAVQRSAAPEV